MSGNLVPAAWLNDTDTGAIVKVYNSGIPAGRLEAARNSFRLSILTLDGVDYVLGRDQLIVLDSFTAERFAADGDRRQALVAGRLLHQQGDVFRTLRDGDAEVSA